MCACTQFKCVPTHIYSPATIVPVADEELGVAAWRALLLAHSAALRAIDADVRRDGRIPLAWYDVLLELNSAESRRLRMNDLSEKVVLSRTRVSRVVDAMEDAGLVIKKSDDTDARVTWATMTAAGRVALRTAAPVYLDAIDRHFTRHLSKGALNHVKRALLRIADVHGRP